MKNKIGIGYITCNSPERIAQTYPNIPKGIGGELVVVNSGCVLPETTFDGATKIIQSGDLKSVAVSKNRALRYLMEQECDHIFLIEDDVLITDGSVFGAYLKAAEASGIWHLNYALQGAMNRAQDVDAEITSLESLNRLKYDSTPAPRARLSYQNGSKIAFYPHAIGAFQYFYRGVIKKIGYFDERYENAYENYDYMYRVVKEGLCPPMGWFADLDNSSEYLENLPDCMEKSIIRESDAYGENMLFGRQWFKGKYEITPELVPDTGEALALKRINAIKAKYARSLTK